jgi:hypothetical protein
MMDPEVRFDTIWGRFADLEFKAPTALPSHCPYAQTFSEWVEELLGDLAPPSIVTVNQAKVQLLDKFFEWRKFVPKSHERHLGRVGHVCIYQVFVQAYERLKVIELALTPPMLFIPPPPPPPPLPPPPPQIAGIFLGEDE